MLFRNSLPFFTFQTRENMSSKRKSDQDEPEKKEEKKARAEKKPVLILFSMVDEDGYPCSELFQYEVTEEEKGYLEAVGGTVVNALEEYEEDKAGGWINDLYWKRRITFDSGDTVPSLPLFTILFHTDH